MKNKLTVFLGVLSAIQACALLYLFLFSKPLRKDGGWWVFKGSGDEILRCDLPNSRGYMVVRLFPGALSGVVYFQNPKAGGRSYSIDVGDSYVLTSTSYGLPNGEKISIFDKDGDGFPEFKRVKIDSGSTIRKLSFYEEEK